MTNNPISTAEQAHVGSTGNIFERRAPLIVAAGYSAVPIKPATKYPPLKGWEYFCEHQPTLLQIEDYAKAIPDAGIGLPLGTFNVALDFDSDDAIRAIGSIIPRTPVSKVGKSGFTAIYRQNSAAPVKARKFKSKRDANGHRAMLVEILSHGNQTVIPDTVHPDTGQPYRWTDPWNSYQPGPALWDVAASHLLEITATIADDLERGLIAAGLIDDPAEIARQQTERLARAPQIQAEWLNERHRFVPWLEKRLTAQASSLAAITDGRHDALHSAACAMGPYVAAGLIGEDAVTEALFQACITSGFFDRQKTVQTSSRKEFHRQIDRGLAWGETQPLAPLDERYFTRMGPAPAAPAVTGSPGAVPMAAGQPSLIVGEMETGMLPPPPREIYDRLLPSEPLVSFIAGQSGAGKTFYAIMLAVCAAAGLPFLGAPCQERIGVIYVAAEGAGTIDQRIYSAKLSVGITALLPIATIKRVPDLRDETVRADLLREIKRLSRLMIGGGMCDRVGLLIIDTITFAFAIEDEQSNSDATKIVKILDSLAVQAGMVVCPLHHFGKDKSAGMRGASAWRAAADHMVAILGNRNEETGDVSGRKVAIGKSRTGPEGVFCAFDLETVPLGAKPDGTQRTDAIFVRTDASIENGETGKASSAFIETFDRLYQFEGAKRSLFNGATMGVMENVMRDDFIRNYRGNEAAARKAWQRSSKAALSSDFDLKDGIIHRRNEAIAFPAFSIISSQ